jgi:Family of unknown function (DUF6090)
MIKFFRHIRKSHLMENKTGNYLKYAIGEIILVVIGILIALQLNNLNEQNKLENLMKIQLQAIKKELNEDVKNLKKAIEQIDEDVLKNNAIRERLIAKTATIDTLYKIAKYEFSPTIIGFSSGFNNATYTSLIASGGINSFDETFKKDLSKLYNLQQSTINSIQDHFSSYLETGLVYLANYPSSNATTLQVSGGPFYDYLWNNTDYKKLLIAYNKVSSTKNIYYTQSMMHLKSALTTTESLLQKHFLHND